MFIFLNKQKNERNRKGDFSNDESVYFGLHIYQLDYKVRLVGLINRSL